MKLRLFILLTCFYLGIASREPPWGDAHVVYETTQNLVDHGRIDVELDGPRQFYAIKKVEVPRPPAPPPRLPRPSPSPSLGPQAPPVKANPPLPATITVEKKYGVFPLGNVIAMAPSYALYKVLAKIPRAPTDLLYKYTCHLSTSLLIAGACVLFFAMARREGASERAALWLALGLGTTTILVIYARSPFSEALQTLIYTWVVERALSLGEKLDEKGAAWGGVALGLLLNTKLIYALAAPVVVVYVILCHRREIARLVKCLAIALAPFALLLGGAIAHNHLKTGSFVDSGYQIPEGVFSGDAYAALWGYFFSTGKSIFLYSPLVILGVLALPAYFARRRARGIFLVTLLGVTTLANARFRYWHADYCWGPRLLVPLLPSLLLPAAPWIGEALARGRRSWRALGIGVLVGGGLYVQLLGAAFYWDHYIRIAIAVKDQTGAPGWYGEDLHHCHFIPQFSPLVGHAWLLRHTLSPSSDPMSDVPWKRVAPGKVNIAAEWARVRPDWWGLDWFVKGPTGSPKVGVSLLLLLSAGALWSGLGIRRRLAPLPRAARG